MALPESRNATDYRGGDLLSAALYLNPSLDSLEHVRLFQ